MKCLAYYKAGKHHFVKLNIKPKQYAFWSKSRESYIHQQFRIKLLYQNFLNSLIHPKIIRRKLTYTKIIFWFPLYLSLVLGISA